MTSKQIRWITVGITIASSILALGDKVVQMPGLPGWLTSSWPFILSLAGIFDRVGHILITPNSTTPQQPPTP